MCSIILWSGQAEFDDSVPPYFPVLVVWLVGHL